MKEKALSEDEPRDKQGQKEKRNEHCEMFIESGPKNQKTRSVSLFNQQERFAVRWGGRRNTEAERWGTQEEQAEKGHR